MARKALNSYRKISVETATPIRRVIMVYDGIIKFLEYAHNHSNKPSLEAEDYEKINTGLLKAEALITELRLGLDFTVEGGIANTLNDLYVFWIEQISLANQEKKPEKIYEIITLVTELRDGWIEAEQSLKV
ncbi:flagellar export chaperone FliS [Lentisphaerota bacterium WC36G]|nr:flagellar export chaperone FliS [Lentisphaerae bacterium WC36]